MVATSGEDSGASVGDVGEDGGLFGDIALYGSDQVRNQVETALLDYVHLGKGLIDRLVLLNQRVLRADIATTCEQQNEDEETHNPKHNP